MEEEQGHSSCYYSIYNFPFLNVILMFFFIIPLTYIYSQLFHFILKNTLFLNKFILF